MKHLSRLVRTGCCVICLMQSSMVYGGLAEDRAVLTAKLMIETIDTAIEDKGLDAEGLFHEMMETGRSDHVEVDKSLRLSKDYLTIKLFTERENEVEKILKSLDPNEVKFSEEELASLRSVSDLARKSV